MFTLNFKLKEKFLLLLIALPLIACDLSGNIEGKIGATKFINHFDYDTYNYKLQPTVFSGSDETTIEATFDSDFKQQGRMSLRLDYNFAGSPTEEGIEKISMQKTWGNFRPDLSFHPLGVSFWIHSSGSDNKLNVVLLQQNDEFTLKNTELHAFSYTNDKVLAQEGWQQVIVPYNKFVAKEGSEVSELNLARVNGYRFEIENTSGTANNGTFYLDAFEQLTSYAPTIDKPARFTSMFVQLHPTHHVDHDWDKLFDEYLEVGIDTLIVQFSARGERKGNRPIFYYKAENISWKEKGDEEYHIIEDIFESAEKTGMAVILGLHGGVYPKNKGDAEAYDELYRKNTEVIDELYDKFAGSKAFSGWYICEEFHDGASNGWWKDEYRELLAHYQQRVAAYAKSKPEKFIVTIAPALWRGRPADMTYTFFKTFFERTPDIDILYLQDCGGRCAVDDGDFDVDLPNWYEAIKRACDETGVQFGVDIESFKRCGSENIKWHAKEWDNLKDQLVYAGLFTENITQFSWASFRPGRGAFDDYKEYLREHGMLRSQQQASAE